MTRLTYSRCSSRLGRASAAVAAFASLSMSCASPEPEPAPGPSADALACRTAFSTGHDASIAFWNALEANDRAAQPAVIAGLEAAHTAHPEEAELELLLGLAQLWMLADPPEGADAAAMGMLAGGVLTHLQGAQETCPTDSRIAAWLGPVLVRMGRLTGNETVRTQGMTILEEGAEKNPEFVLFSLAMVLADEPVGSPAFERAVDALRDNISVCGAASSDPACTNGPRAAHNIQGSSIFMGDLFARAGDTDSARAFYESARTTPGYDTWNDQAMLEERLTNLEMRVALSQDADPTNDPLMVTSTSHACSVCHAD
jgi:hypothetical protein